MGHFRSSVWDPVLIVAQMVTMQCVFYIGLGICILAVDYIAGSDRSIDHIFNSQLLNFRDLQGKLLMVAVIVNALVGGLGLWYVVQRTKLCWDFAATVYVFHLFLCWMVGGKFPSSISWWFISIAAGVIMTVCGEFLCMRSELKAIPLTGSMPRVDL